MPHSSSARRRSPALAAALLALLGAAAACSDNPNTPTGPVTLRFLTIPYYSNPNPTPADSARGVALVSIDGGPEFEVRSGDSLPNVARGEHTFAVRYNVDYLTSEFTVNINPNSRTTELFLPQAASCRYFPADYDEGGRTNFCTPGVKRNILNFTGAENLVCAANDYGEFCSTLPDENQLGGTWPSTGINQVIAHAKLLVAATVPVNATGGTYRAAMSLYNPGDYAPRTRLRPIAPTDSSRFTNDAWTDARHVPFYYASNQTPRTPLGLVDRFNANFGLAVKSTYYMHPSFRDVIFVRFDVTNISAAADYRRVNPEVPTAGQTITEVYLTPFIDASFGIDAPTTPGEVADDNATVFPEENLIAAYDQNFSVTLPSTGGAVTVNNTPGLVGFQHLGGPAGVSARAVIIDRADSLSFTTVALEQATHRILAAGRAGDETGCALQGGIAYVCSPETPNNVLAGWSFGPIASIAPGQTYTVTVAVMVAAPTAGTFTSGGNYVPQNAQIGDNTRTIAQIAAGLRALAQQTQGITVP
jgi:hypothetical protein